MIFLSILNLPGCAGPARDCCLVRMMIHTVWNECLLCLDRYVARCRHDIQEIEIRINVDRSNNKPKVCM